MRLKAVLLALLAVGLLFALSRTVFAKALGPTGSYWILTALGEGVDESDWKVAPLFGSPITLPFGSYVRNSDTLEDQGGGWCGSEGSYATFSGLTRLDPARTRDHFKLALACLNYTYDEQIFHARANGVVGRDTPVHEFNGDSCRVYVGDSQTNGWTFYSVCIGRIP